MDVVWSDLALAQLNNILDYVEDNYGASVARQTLGKITSKVSRLSLFPSSGIWDAKYTSLVADGEVTIRHIQVFPNVVYYLETAERIEVIALMHEKQSPETVAKTIKAYINSKKRD